MDFVSFEFYLFLAIVIAAYYVIPLRFRWYALLIGSLSYFWIATQSKRGMIVFLAIIAVSYVLGILLEIISKSDNRVNKVKSLLLLISIAVVLVPLAASKYQSILYAFETLLHKAHTGVVVPLGLSFFTMQIISYLVDVYKGKISAQRNPLKYALFISFFPQIIQGPIPRYDQLEPQLVEGHRFDGEEFTKGMMLILWGFFLKLMIADKAGIVVDTIYGNTDAYRGAYVLVAGVLYSIQLYADFLACITLAQGISCLFGIHLIDNFNHPYFATSIKEFWGRWHISLSSWLRDYVYIPLGGNRKGKLRKYINLCITFAVSGIWHGTGYKYIFWGLMHAGYQIAGEWTSGIRDKFFALLQIPKEGRARRWIKRGTTFFFVMLAWVIFRASSLRQGLYMLKSMFTTYNPWIFSDNSLLALGLDWKNWNLLLISILVLILVSMWQEKFSIRDRILAQPFCLRCALYIVVVIFIMAFGTYGYGYDAADFIYGGF